MDLSELELTNKAIKMRLETFTPPVPITEEAIRVYDIAHMRGASLAIRLCRRDVVKRDLSIVNSLIEEEQ